MTEEKPKVEKKAQEIIAERRAKQDQTAHKDQKNKDNATIKATGPKKPGQVNWAMRVLLLLIIFLLGAGATLYFLPVLKERIPLLAQWVGSAPSNDPAFAQEIDKLERRVARHEDEITVLKNAKTYPVSSEPDPVLLERLDSLEQTVRQAKENKQRSTQDMSQSARIDMLLGRMSQLEASFVPLSKGLSDAQTARI